MNWKTAIKPYHLKLFFSNKYCYAQVLRIEDGHIVAAASTVEKSLRESLPRTSTKEGASVIGRLLAERALAKKVPAVHWPRKRGQKYHGKIAAVIDAMKASGLPLN